MTAHQRPKLEVYDGVVFVVLKPVRYVDHEEVVDVTEIALFLGLNFVVTVRHGHSDVLGQVRAELDRGETQLLGRGPTAVLYRAADLVVDGYEEAIVSITEDVDEIESQVFSGDDQDHAERIYKLKREIAEFRRAVLPLATPLHRLAEESVPVVDKAAAPYFRDVHDHALQSRRRHRGPRPPALRRPPGQPGPGRGTAEPDRGPPERGHAPDLRLGRDRTGADRHRRHLRDELRVHARAHLEVRLLRGHRPHRQRLPEPVPAVPPQRLALGRIADGPASGFEPETTRFWAPAPGSP